jgi:hypothetical protein
MNERGGPMIIKDEKEYSKCPAKNKVSFADYDAAMQLALSSNNEEVLKAISIMDSKLSR